ncbi:hypothetical protein ABZ214_29995 [Streptomyces iakyrus]|uniref:hypothetical protein n=1 Tax=Streptomyces iakyrus TaxID=68219 RepID=UPI0033AD54C6
MGYRPIEELVSGEEIAGRANEVMALVKDHLDADDPRRVRLALRLRPIISGDVTASDRDLMGRALDAAYCSLDDELARVRSLRNIRWAARRRTSSPSSRRCAASGAPTPPTCCPWRRRC